MPATDAQSIALGKLLLIQHALEVLPNETSIASFLYRSLSTIPGVKDVHVCIRDVVMPDDAMYRELCRACGDSGAAPASPPRTQHFPLRTPHRVYGALFLSIDNEDRFAFCQPYLANTANIVATLLESRDHVQQLNAANELIQRGRDELEVRVTQRTADLLRANEELQREVAERQVAEEKNQRLTQLYAALSQCNEAIVRCTREEELFPIICRSAVDFGGMRMAWIGLVDPASRRVVPVASYGEGTDYLEGIQISVDATDPFGCGPVGTAIRSKQPYWCQDYQRDPVATPWHERAARFGWNAAASLPLQRNGVVIGIFALFADKANAFDQAARKLLLEMAADISFALDNFAREAERKQAQAALADSKNLLQSILDTAPVRIFWKDRALRYLGCNPAFARDAGEAGPADLLGKDDYQLGWKAQAELYRADDRRVMDTGIPRLSYDEPQTTPDGKNIWLRTSKVPLHNVANETIGVLGLYEDITERKQAELALQRSEDSLNRAQAVAQIGSWRLDVATNRIEWSAEAFRIFGVPRKEAVDLATFVSAVHPDDRETVLKTWNEALAGAPYDIEHRVVANGETRWVRERAVIERDAQGRPLFGVGTTQDITERKQAEERIQYLAHFDALTGLPNRTQLDDRLKYALSLAKRGTEHLAVMFIDLDRFKDINDTLGHSAGDALLVELANRLKMALREEDTVSRLSGDEFIVMLPGTDADGAAQVAQKLLDVIAQPFQVEHHELNVTASIGIALHPGDGGNLEALSKSADTAMYLAKQEGRNCFRFFTAAMQTGSARHLQLANALRHALERQQLQVVYQPQLSAHDARVIGAEALLRWQHPELGALSPAEFIPIAEDSGLILPIGEWVLRCAVRQAKKWTENDQSPLIMAVNLSAIQFRHPDLPELVTRILDEEGLPPEHLELELTEGVAMHDPQGAIAVMDKLHERGIRMSIDDFGTGYSSLAYLKKFKVYKLKIDQSFVRDISTDPEDKAIVSAIIQMAKSLGLKTIAEGVETAGQLAFLREQGCDEVQGYYYSKPCSAEQFEVFARARNPSII